MFNRILKCTCGKYYKASRGVDGDPCPDCAQDDPREEEKQMRTKVKTQWPAFEKTPKEVQA